ncbi:hypothetical protein BpHYR1_042820 [Brachionus plicatilis]|uniref:Uncharacterized protein n=1 Tax=Brachionus plicatilis TaxID=10195 RepID=A0A3M7Q3C7_BRAPC|nr:hypothetical protein BpHYR1_042820 [Brachionus plicatilis]
MAGQLKGNVLIIIVSVLLIINVTFTDFTAAPISLALGKDFHLNLIHFLDTLFFLMNDKENEAILQKNDFQRSMKNILKILRILNIIKKAIIYQYLDKNLIRYYEGIVWMIEKAKLQSCVLITFEIKIPLIWFKHVDDFSMEESLIVIKTSDIVSVAATKKTKETLILNLKAEKKYFALILNGIRYATILKLIIRLE